MNEKQRKSLNQSNEIYLKKQYPHRNVFEDLQIGCTDCDFVTKNILEYSNHSKNTHSLIVGTNKLKCKCTLCNFMVCNYNGLKRHTLTKHSNRSFHCNICSYVTSRKDSLKDHIMMKHENRAAYNCQHCKFRCMRPVSFRTHMYRNHQIQFNTDNQDKSQTHP